MGHPIAPSHHPESAVNVADQRAQAERDLREVAEQRASGELDEITADRLAATYQAELDRLQPEADGAPEPVVAGRSRSRFIVGAVLLVAAFAGVIWAAGGALVERDADAFSAPDRQVDLSTISNDQMVEVINANPDVPEINRMRLALAERYFEAGDFSEALTWFQTVLDANPAPVEESEALARVGWMILESGDSDTALRFVDMALEANPANLEATYFRGLVYARMGRSQEALTDLQTVATSPDVPDDVKSLVLEAIAVLEDQS